MTKEDRPIEFEFVNETPGQEAGFERFLTGKELISKHIEEIPMLVKDIMPRVSLGGFIGESDAMKSTALLNLCEKIVADDKFDNQGNIIYNKFVMWDICPLYHRCLYYSTEDDPLGLSNRLLKQNKTMHLSENELERLEVCFDFGDDFLMNLQQRLERQQYDLVVVDGWEDVFTGDSHNNVQVRTYLNPIKEMAHLYGTNILLLNHIGKRTADLSPSKNHALGSQAWEAKMRYVFQWSKNKKEDDQCWFTVVKGNLIAPRFKKQSYGMRVDDNLTFTYSGETCDIENNVQNEEKTTKKQAYDLITEQIIHKKEVQGMTWKQLAIEYGGSESGIQNRVYRYKSKERVNVDPLTHTHSCDGEKLT